MEGRTSKDHPLQIAPLKTTGAGLIGMTLCPGKKDQAALTGAWNRDLDTDLQAILDWGAKVLVTLMEDYELRQLGVSEIGERASELGLEWYHLPIQDVSIPDSEFEKAWEEVSPILHKHLDAGEHVVLHCRGGLGRTGTIAARMLVETGETPQNALHRVRVARVGTVETEEQEEYILSLGDVPDDEGASADDAGAPLDTGLY